MKTSISVPLVMISALISVSCGNGALLPDAPRGTNATLASVMKTGERTGTVYLTDYYPGLQRVDSVTAVGGLRVVADDPTWRTFNVVADGKGPLLGEIKVWSDSVPLSIVTQAETGEPYGYMYPVSADGGRVTLQCEETPDNVIALWQNQALPPALLEVRDRQVSVSLPANARGAGRSFLRVYAAGADRLLSDVLVPLQDGMPVTDAAELTRFDRQAQILYSLMIDRFHNGNHSNDWKLASPEVLDIVDYQGGDIAGITQKIREGYFNDLGVTTIWISPITQNPWDAWGQYPDPRTKFTGYHGYWPLYVTVIDKRFATEAELREMLDVAHEQGLNVILDYVSNHMHVDSPTLKENPGWTTPLELPDGTLNLERWDGEHRLTTWFDMHIPTLDLERREVYQPLTDSALYWVTEYDFDGFRHDATKHVPEVFWRTLTAKMKERLPDRQLYQIGETYGSPELIGSYVKSGMMDAQFDFNVYDRAIWNIASPQGSMKSIADELEQSLRYYGYHNLMGYITGNHDRPRFISLAGGALTFEEDSKAAGWKRDITVGDATVAYDKLALLEAFIMTIPGVPCIYQGDEYGVPGGNDPDNRRMMQFAGYGEQEQRLLETVRRLTHLRRGNMALMYGQYLPVNADDHTLVFMRTYLGTTAVAILNGSGAQADVSFELPYEGAGVSSLASNFGHTARMDGNRISVTLPPYGFEILSN